MKTNVQQLPAGIITGIEAFVYNNLKYLNIEGVKVRFHNAPGSIQQVFAKAFMSDNKFKNWIKTIGITTFNEGFEKWFFCKFGAYDNSPDLINETLCPDKYNSACTNTKCEMRGIMCGKMGFALKNYEVETIKELQKGNTCEEAAKTLYISIPGMKSRIQHLKEKTGARNTAHLIALATSLGV